MPEDSEELQKLARQVANGVHHILFVCKGNVCRSPVAENLLKSEIDRLDLKELTTRSAGLIELERQLVVEELFEVAEEFGVTLKNHKSAILTKEIISQANLVFVMENYQKEEVQGNFPEHKEKVFLLSVFDSEANGTNINDPLGTTDYQYRYCFNRLYQLVQELVEFLKTSNALHEG